MPILKRRKNNRHIDGKALIINEKVPEEISAQIEEIMQEVEHAEGKDGANRWKKAVNVLMHNKKAMADYCSAEQAKVFEQYYALGEGRTISQLSRVTGHSYARLDRWKRKYNWDMKIIKRDIEIAAILKAKTIDSIVNAKIDYSAIINQTIRDFIDNIREYNEKVRMVNRKAKHPKDLIPYKTLICNAGDFEKLVKLDLLMRGDATERKEEIVNQKIDIIEKQISEDDKTKALLKELYHRSREYAEVLKKSDSIVFSLKSFSNNRNEDDVLQDTKDVDIEDDVHIVN